MNQIYAKAHVRKTSETSVEVIRSFKAPRNLVYRTFTEPALIKKWMLGPPGWEMPVCEIDLKEGGKYKWRWKHKSNGQEFGFFGVYRQIVAPKTVTNTQTFDPGTMGGSMGKECVVSANFTDAGEQTTVTTKIEFQSAEDMEQSLSTGMTDGMEMSYQALDKFIQELAK